MGCASSRERASIRQSRKVSQAMSLDNTNKSSDTTRIANKDTPDRDESRRARTSNFKANDRVSLAAALEDYDYEGSNHTASTRSTDSAVICIMRSDKLAFSGAGIRRHSRRKRKRHNGCDNTRIIVLRKPSRRDTTMMKVDERIPTKELKALPLKKITIEKKETRAQSSPDPALPEKKSRPPRAPRTPPKKPKSFKNKSPLKAVRKLNRKGSDKDVSDIMMIDERSREQILSMSISSRDFRPFQ